MTLKQKVEEYLESEPIFRERKNKDRGIVNLLRSRYQQLQEISKETLIAAVQDYNSMDRYWRMILEEKTELRGSDYDTKDQMEARTMKNLGYNVKEKSLPVEAVETVHQQELL